VRNHTFLWLAGVFLLAALLLLLTSFSYTLVLVLVLALVSGGFLARGLGRQPPGDNFTSRPEETDSQAFALSHLFEATMEGMREGLLVVDREMRVIASNTSARRLFNSSPASLNAQRLTQLTRNPAIYSAFLDALRGKERAHVKVETFGTGRRIFDLRVVPLEIAADGQPSGAIGVFFDITKLEKLERVRQEFLSNVSHELRTPLTAILAFIETLESGAINEEDGKRFLGIIRKNALRMHGLIDDILELTAIEAGTVKVQPKPVELWPLVEDVFSSLDLEASLSKVALVNKVEPETMVFADPARLEQMLTNLVGNAIKFNREGGNVILSCESGEWSKISVEDTGEGIPAQHLERLFERFYRVDRARSRDVGGTGLGLAIVKHLAHAHGGEVSVESRLGEGSVFVIELPPSLNLRDSSGSRPVRLNLLRQED
jgi:two-component system phosphate regulon sensor histidine kinase PhoR